MVGVKLSTLLAFTACTVSSARCTAATEFMPRVCDAGWPAVRSMAIEHNVMLSELVADRQTDCSAFVLDAATVRWYFARMRRVDALDPDHEVDWSPCGAIGTLRLSDGRRA